MRASGRRAGLAGRRRKPTFAELFTACYSSVFATAAIIDAVQKDGRRRQLDRQLDDARRELSDLYNGDDGSMALGEGAQVGSLTSDQNDALWRCLKTIYKNRPFMKEIDKPVTASLSALVARLKTDYYGCPTGPWLEAARKTDYRKLEDDIIAEESDPSIVSREPRNGIQLQKESMSAELLVQKLLDRAHLADPSSAPSQSFDEARSLIEMGHSNFTFRSVDPERARENSLLLNKRLRSLVDAPQLGVKEMIGRVCYNLLVSAHPPDMHTYNTLIVAFDKCGHYAFSDALVHSFFYRRLLRPTPSTFVAILNHYKETGNHGQFLRALACLAGVDSKTGAKVGRRHVEDVEEHASLRRWAADTRMRTRTGDWVWEHFPLDGTLVEKVITGLLHFKLFDQAALFFVSCMRSGVVLSGRVVRQVLDECLYALDWRAAIRLIRGLSGCGPRWKRMLAGLDRDGAAKCHLLDRLYSLVHLCGLGRPKQPPSEGMLNNLAISGPRLDYFLRQLAEERGTLGRTTELIDLGPGLGGSRLLEIESLWKEVVHVRRTTMSIESKILQADLGMDFRTAMALHIGGAAAERSRQLGGEAVELMGLWAGEGEGEGEGDETREEETWQEEAGLGPGPGLAGVGLGFGRLRLERRRGHRREVEVSLTGSLTVKTTGRKMQAGEAPRLGAEAVGLAMVGQPAEQAVGLFCSRSGV